jgi:hypothetical protein
MITVLPRGIEEPKISVFARGHLELLMGGMQYLQRWNEGYTDSNGFFYRDPFIKLERIRFWAAVRGDFVLRGR